MLRPVEDIQRQTRQAVEDRVMGYIDTASNIDCSTEVYLLNNTVPDWLVLNLKRVGYSVQRFDDGKCRISWGYGND